jgi:hypothetical protein
MADETQTTDVVETQTTEVVEVTRTVEATPETPAASEPAVDWDAAPVYEETVVEETTIVTADVQPDATVYAAPRGRWDFTDPQRIIIGVLLWLNILVIVMAYLAVSGQLTG